MENKFKYISTTQIDALAGGDTDFKKDLSTIFLEQIEEFVAKMSQFLKDQEWKKLAREAHTAKSSAMTFGMEDTGNLLKNIQLDCESGEREKVPQMVEDAISQLQGAVPELKQILDS